MADFSDETSSLKDRIATLVDDLDRHVRVLDSIAEEPEEYDASNVEEYLDDLDDALRSADFLETAEQALTPLEEAVDEAEQEFLENARIFVDDREIDGIEFLSLDPEEASILVDSPKVNQIRGGTQILELEDGREFSFTVEETLVADVADDKTGKLELVLGLEEL